MTSEEMAVIAAMALLPLSRIWEQYERDNSHTDSLAQVVIYESDRANVQLTMQDCKNAHVFLNKLRGR